jgi:hypothetical protein
MASRELPLELKQSMVKSFDRSLKLLNHIYFSEKSFREQDLQVYSDRAHAAKDALIKELDDVMSLRIRGPLSPPPLKIRGHPRSDPVAPVAPVAALLPLDDNSLGSIANRANRNTRNNANRNRNRNGRQSRRGQKRRRTNNNNNNNYNSNNTNITLNS